MASSIRREITALKKELAALRDTGGCGKCGMHTCWQEDGVRSVFSCRKCKANPIVIDSDFERTEPCSECGYMAFRIPFTIERVLGEDDGEEED